MPKLNTPAKSAPARKVRKTGRRHPLATLALIAIGLGLTGGVYAAANATPSTASADTAAASQQDVSDGQKLFAANCATCHSVTGDLKGVGAKYSQPSAMLARIAWPAPRPPRPATVTTPAGQKLTGTLAHYDDFETTLTLADGTTQTWPTDTVKVEIPDPIAGHRALLPKYSDDDLHNLTRYLLTIK